MFQVYVKNSNEALEFYQKAFDAKLLVSHLHDNGTIAHAEIDIYGQTFAVCEASKDEVISGNTMQLCLHFGEGKEDCVQKAFDVLKENAAEIHGPYFDAPWSTFLFGVIDKYGVNWCVYV